MPKDHDGFDLPNLIKYEIPHPSAALKKVLGSILNAGDPEKREVEIIVVSPDRIGEFAIRATFSAIGLQEDITSGEPRILATGATPPPDQESVHLFFKPDLDSTEPGEFYSTGDLEDSRNEDVRGVS